MSFLAQFAPVPDVSRSVGSFGTNEPTEFREPVKPTSPHASPPELRSLDPAPTDAVLRATLPSPVPHECDCPTYWLDPYGSLHCCRCEPPLKPALVRGRVRVRLLASGDGFRWSHEPEDPIPTIPPEWVEPEYQPDDEPPCPTCGDSFFWWNPMNQKFCQNCHAEKFQKNQRLVNRAASLRHHYDQHPETIRRFQARQQRQERLAAERDLRESSALARAHQELLAEDSD